MKKLICILGCLIVIASSCNDDEDGVLEPVETPTSLLTKISQNGVAQIEMFYDVEKKLFRLDNYDNGVLTSYTLYEYDRNGIKELRRYLEVDNFLDYRTVFTLDNSGRVVKGENYSGPNMDKISSTNQFTYNASGQLIRKDSNLPGQPIYLRTEYTYDDQNNLIKVQSTANPTEADKYITSKTDFTPGSRPVPPEWENYIFLLELSGQDDLIMDIFNNHTQIHVWTSDQQIYYDSSKEPSGRILDANGNLTAQTLTNRDILPQQQEIISEMTYEYVK